MLEPLSRNTNMNRYENAKKRFFGQKRQRGGSKFFVDEVSAEKNLDGGLWRIINDDWPITTLTTLETTFVTNDAGEKRFGHEIVWDMLLWKVL